MVRRCNDDVPDTGDIMSEETRGRKPKTDIVPAAKAMDAMQMSIQEIEELYSDGEPYDLDRLVVKAKAHVSNIAESLAVTGGIFQRIKAHESHGDFMLALERTGIKYSFAWFAMTCVVKLGDESNFSPVKNLGMRKTKALFVFDKPIIQEYLNGGDLLTIPHDDVEKMSSRELEVEVRKLREQIKSDKEASEKRLKAVESIIKSKETKLTELELEVANRLPPTKTELAQSVLDELRRDYMGAILNAGYEVRRALEVIAKAQGIEGVNFTQLQTFVHQYDEHYAALCDSRDTLEQAINNACPDKE